MSKPQNSFRDLMVWQKAMKLVSQVYQATGGFPKDELYGLTSQIRRCAVSIPSNIAEGQGRLGDGEFRQFLSTALGSCMELHTQILIAQDLGYLRPEMTDSLIERLDEVSKMTRGLVAAVEKRKGASSSSL